jgi:hypothetical protein
MKSTLIFVGVLICALALAAAVVAGTPPNPGSAKSTTLAVRSSGLGDIASGLITCPLTTDTMGRNGNRLYGAGTLGPCTGSGSAILGIRDCIQFFGPGLAWYDVACVPGSGYDTAAYPATRTLRGRVVTYTCSPGVSYRPTSYGSLVGNTASTGQSWNAALVC